MVKVYVGNTDHDWFDFLAGSGALEEVNFWQPSAKNFRAISTGEFFAFRLKSPRNAIGGFGVVSSAQQLPIQVAWDTFGTGNGVKSISDFISQIQRYRPDERVSYNTMIGCRILVQPVFLAADLWQPLPEGWARNIVSGRTYDTESPEGLQLWQKLEEILRCHEAGRTVDLYESQSRFGEPALIRPRLGQGAFRISVMEAYRRQCALSAGRVLPALDAAHILPFHLGGEHVQSNGILLRKDIHSVFDAGLATFDDDYRFVVSPKVREIFNNGHEYRRLHGSRLALPENPEHHPSRNALTWHRDERFEK